MNQRVNWNSFHANDRQRHIFPRYTDTFVAIITVFLVGLSKGRLDGVFALMGVPILSLVMPPFQAAALLRPILLMMNKTGVWTWRGWFDLVTLWHWLPSAMVGIAIGALTAAITTEAFVQLIVMRAGGLN